MTTFGTIATIGGVAIAVGIGVGIYVYSKNNSNQEWLNFEQFKDTCINSAKKYPADSVISTVIVIDRDGEVVIPSLYRRYENGKVTKTKLNCKSFPYLNLPEDKKASFKNGQCILAKL